MYNEDKGSDTMLKKAYIVPHPPIILPEVGKGQERSIQNTVNAYRMIAHDIAATKPQTIIIFSPHAPCYRDYIQISQGAQAYGNFEAFGVEDSDMKVLYDEDFVDMLCNAAAAQGLPAGTLGEQNQTLDHGTMVPLHFILQEYTDFRLVRISVSGLDRNTQVLFGDCLRRVIDESQRNVAVIASGDLSHKLKEDGPYGLHPLGAVFDEQIVSIIKDNDYARLLDMDEEIVEESANCGYPAFLMLYGVLQAYPIDSQFLSYEGPFGVGYATAIISVMKKDPYVALARESLEVYHPFTNRAASTQHPAKRIASTAGRRLCISEKIRGASWLYRNDCTGSGESGTGDNFQCYICWYKRSPLYAGGRKGAAISGV